MLSDLLQCALDSWNMSVYIMQSLSCFVCPVVEGHANVGWVGEGYVGLCCVCIGCVVLVWVVAQV